MESGRGGGGSGKKKRHVLEWRGSDGVMGVMKMSNATQETGDSQCSLSSPLSFLLPFSPFFLSLSTSEGYF